jgi:hypothetical protein
VEGKKKRKARRESALHNSTMTDFTEQEIVWNDSQDKRNPILIF